MAGDYLTNLVFYENYQVDQVALPCIHYLCIHILYIHILTDGHLFYQINQVLHFCITFGVPRRMENPKLLIFIFQQFRYNLNETNLEGRDMFPGNVRSALSV